MFAGRTVWLFSRTDVQTRCSAFVWTITSCSSCCCLSAKTLPEEQFAHGGPSVDGGHHDSIAETRREVRGIATGKAFVSGTTVCQNCGISQFPIPPTSAGTDCVGHIIRALTDANTALTVTSIDGVGAYDHVYRSAMLSKLLEVPALQGLLPFARFAYGETTTYVWEDEEGVRHQIRQGEGSEQGVHNALREGKNCMIPGEHLLAFLDDTYILSLPQRARPLYNVMGTTLETGAGIHLHAGKTRIWNRAGIRPPDIGDLGEEVWSPDGVKVLGSPIGTQAFIQSY